jgi:hypothetical protein
VTAWPFIAGGCFALLAGWTALAHWLAGLPDHRPPYKRPPQFTLAVPVTATGPLALFPGDCLTGVAERHARALDRNLDRAHAALDRITTTLEDGDL